jgi:short-subunit dehydrogenase
MTAWGRTYIPKPEHGAAWITGASGGIGRAVALRLAADGWTVYATARSKDKLMSLAGQSNGRIIAAPGDVTDAAEMEAIVAQIEGAEGLALAIFNAGVYIPMRAQEFTAEDAAKHFNVNLQGVANGLAPAMRGMIERKTGCLALVASVAGYRGLPKAAAYGATKAALINMAEALAYDLHPAGVRISLICPGFVDTDATAVNDFDMPFLMQTDEAAERIVKGLKTTAFEIAFPRRFAFILKSMRFLPARAYLWLGRKAMGWDKIDD